MSQEQSVENVLAKFSVNCQHIQGQPCFVPANAVQQFVDECKSGGLVMAHGEVYAPQDGYLPIVALLHEEIFRRTSEFADRAGMSVPEFVVACLVSMMDDGDTLEKMASIIREVNPMDGIPAPGETANGLPPPGGNPEYVPSTESDDPPDPWAFDMSYGSTAERDPEHDYSNQTKIPKISRETVKAAKTAIEEDHEATIASNNVLPRLRAILSDIHVRKQGPLEIWIGAHKEDKIELHLKYPTDGDDIKASYEGDFEECLTKLSDRLERWSSVAFSPKLEEGQEAIAQVGVEILGWDSDKGKYKARVGDATIYLPREMVGKVEA